MFISLSLIISVSELQTDVLHVFLNHMSHKRGEKHEKLVLSFLDEKATQFKPCKAGQGMFRGCSEFITNEVGGIDP